MKKVFMVVMAIVMIGVFSCKKDYQNPNGPTPDDLVKTQRGMVELVVGIKNKFAVNGRWGGGVVFNMITANGFTTKEITLKAGGNQNYGQLSSGGNNLATTNEVLTELWSNCMNINHFCSLLLNNLQNAPDPAIGPAIKKYALLYKAMSIGIMSSYWQEVPIATSENAVFVSSSEALKEAVSLLNQALLVSIQNLSVEYAAIFGTEIDMKNTINALLARYNMMLLNNDEAIVSASRVSLSSRSIFIYNAQNRNPVYNAGFSAGLGYVVSARFGLPASLLPDLADLRTNFYTIAPSPSPVAGYGFSRADADPLPVYLPGEMLLITAEAFARKGDLINSKLWLDKIVTKKRTADVFGIGAELPPYSGPTDSTSIMIQIYKHRCIELFMSGLKLPDSRRFLRPGPGTAGEERNRNYYPIPLQERNGNINTPKDPDN